MSCREPRGLSPVVSVSKLWNWPVKRLKSHSKLIMESINDFLKKNSCCMINNSALLFIKMFWVLRRKGKMV